ncbi:MAG: hypothetical protein MZV63_65890 [Marinilabiliales bacterium]|nr:hypothetical protein [Marinilabiliales bacterium]
MMTRTASDKRLTVLVALAFAVAFVAAPALAEQKFEEKFEKTEALAANGKLYLSNVSGEIAVDDLEGSPGQDRGPQDLQGELAREGQGERRRW